MLLVSSRMRSCVTAYSLAPKAPCRGVRWRLSRCEHDEVTGGDQALMRRRHPFFIVLAPSRLIVSRRFLPRLPDAAPHLLRCERHVEVGDAERRERIERRA